jgi:hypothetical protein
MTRMNRAYMQRRVTDPEYRPMLTEPTMRSNWATFRTVFFYGDTVTVRALLMVASLGQAVGFWLPLGTMDRPYFQDMRFWPGWVWGTLYTTHAAAQWWRFRAPANRLAGFMVNLYGFCLWTFTTLLGSFATRTYSPATALEWTVIAAMFFALIRTGDPSDRLSP